MLNYNGLFEILDRREMKKTDLLKVISSGTLAKLNKNQNIQTEVLNKLCDYLKVQPGDIMEYYEIEEISLLKKNEIAFTDEDILYKAGYRQKIIISYPQEVNADEYYEQGCYIDYNEKEIKDMVTGRNILISKRVYENTEEIKNGKVKIPKTFKNKDEITTKDPIYKKILLETMNKKNE